MFFRLLILLTVIPFVELYFLIRLSDSIGFGNTILIVLGTGVLGAWMLRQQGLSILNEIQQQGSQGRLPSDAIAKGFFTFIGGVLLLTPGVLTDVLGLTLIFPPTQFLWKRFFLGQWEKAISSGNVQVFTTQGFRRPSYQDQTHRPDPLYENRQSHPQVIDIEVQSSTTVEKDEES